MKSKINILLLSLLATVSFYDCDNGTTAEQTVNKRVQSSEAGVINMARVKSELTDTTRAQSVTVKEQWPTLPADTGNNITAEHAPLVLIVKNLESPTAPVVVGVYGPNNRFLDERDQLKKYTFRPQNGLLVAEIRDLNYGDLAMALYQDVNEDGKINKNPLGIPKEPYAFSNGYKPVIRAPGFNDCRFSYGSNKDTVVISLLR